MGYVIYPICILATCSRSVQTRVWSFCTTGSHTSCVLWAIRNVKWQVDVCVHPTSHNPSGNRYWIYCVGFEDVRRLVEVWWTRCSGVVVGQLRHPIGFPGNRVTEGRSLEKTIIKTRIVLLRRLAQTFLPSATVTLVTTRAAPGTEHARFLRAGGRHI